MDQFKKYKSRQEHAQLRKNKLEEEYKKRISVCEEIISKYNRLMTNCYADFFAQKKSQEFEFIDRYPSFEVFQKYALENNKFPLYEHGIFNVLELAELIKQMYQFERQKEYHIFTIGINECDSTDDHEFQFVDYVPHLYYFIGTDKTLEGFKEFNNTFINLKGDIRTFHTINSAKGKDFVSIPVNRTFEMDQLDLQCLTGTDTDKPKKINYYDYEAGKMERCAFSSNYNIFKGENEIRSLIRYGRYSKKNIWGYRGIKDVLSFKMHIEDSFLAKILMSICIYKKNNGIHSYLTKDDYDHIFKALYGETVDIFGSIEKDFTRSLKYVNVKELIYQQKA